MYEHDSDKSRASGFSFDAFGNVRDDTYYSLGDDLGSIGSPHSTSHDVPRMDPHAMDWTPTPTGHASNFHHNSHINIHEQEDLIDFDDIAPAPAQVSGVGRLVAQFENKDYVPPLPPRPIADNASSPAETNQSLTDSSFSSYFGSLTSIAQANQMPSPVGSPVDSQYGSFGDVLSRITSPQDISSMESSSPMLTFSGGGFPDMRLASPHMSAVRSHIPSVAAFSPMDRTRTPFTEARNSPAPAGGSMDTDLFGEVEYNILRFLKNDVDGERRQRSPTPAQPSPVPTPQPSIQASAQPTKPRAVPRAKNRPIQQPVQQASAQQSPFTQPSQQQSYFAPQQQQQQQSEEQLRQQTSQQMQQQVQQQVQQQMQRQMQQRMEQQAKQYAQQLAQQQSQQQHTQQESMHSPRDYTSPQPQPELQQTRPQLQQVQQQFLEQSQQHQRQITSHPEPQASQQQPGQFENIQEPQRQQSQQVQSPPTVVSSPTTVGTPGFSVWRAPGSPEIKQEQSISPILLTKNVFAKPPVPPKPKPLMDTKTGSSGSSQESSASSVWKGKSPVKPPKPPKPPASRLPPMPPRPRATGGLTINEPIPPTSKTPTSSTKQPAAASEEPESSSSVPATSSPTSTLKQAVAALRNHAALRPGREIVSAESWDHHKPTIRKLYLEERKPLKEVMAIMNEKYKFQATPKMYKTRFSQWGFVKNNTEDEVKKLLSMKFQRDAEGKISEFVRNGKVVNIGTYLKRKGVTEYDLIDLQQPADLPAHIRCRTPTPPPTPAYFRAPDLVRARELLVGNIRKAFVQCRQFEVNVKSEAGWTSLQTWGAWSSDLLLEANFFFEALDADTGGQCLMRAFKQLEEDLKTMSPLGIFELLTGMINRDLGMVTSLCKYLAAHATTNLAKEHPLRAIFNCLYEVQQKHGTSVVSEVLWGCATLFANELEAIYGRCHPYVARAWLDLAYYNNHVNADRLQKIALELRVVQKQLEQRNGLTDPEVLVVRYAILQMMYVTEPKSDNTKHATTELWHTLKSMNVLFRIRDSKSNAYCFHSPVRLAPWTKRCRRRYDAAITIFEDHLGVKLHPYFEEDLHTSLHELESHDSWATAMEQARSSNRMGYI